MSRIKHALFISLFLVLVFGAAHAQAPTAGIVNSTANVRSGPGTNNDIVGSLPEGATVEITGCNAECDWYQIGPDRWIAAFLVDATAAPVAQAQTQQPALVAGKMAPLGDQLGDVGQYYSNAGASFGSKTYIQNTTGTAITATINLYNDEGVLIISPAPLRSVPANGRLRAEFSATDGKLRLYEDTTSGVDTTAEQLGTALYGVYHMKITAPTHGLQVVTRNWRPVSNTFAMTDAAGIRGEQAATTLYLPEVTIDRATRWDTEIVVQNVGATDTIIRFELRADNGTFLNESSVPPGLANNEAVLKPNERRIFLASQLAYAPNNGALIALNGTYGVRVHSTLPNGANGAKVVAYTRVFRQGTADAENGALEAFMYTLPPLANEILAPGFIQGGGNTSSARIMNPTNATIVVDYWVYDQNEQLYTNSATLPAYGGLYLRSDTTSGNLNSSLRVKARDSKQVVGVAWTDTVSGHMGDAMMQSGLSSAMPYLWKNYASDGAAQSTMRHLNTGADTRSYTFFPPSSANNLGTVTANLSSELTAANSAMPGNSGIEYWGVMKGTIGPNHATSVSNGTSATAIGYSASYQPQPSSSLTWYVPFVPAPVVAFAWDTSATDNGNNGTMPGPRYGVALFPDKRDQAVSWFKDLNWYLWPFLWDISSRNLVNDQCKSDIRFMVMDKGLAEYPKAPTSGRDPNMVFNSAVRMNAIRNLVPSACTGRPLFLANEPDFVSLQAYMSYPELARQQFVYRAWPGELFSPAFAHASYNDLLDPNTGGFHALGIDRPCELVPPFTPPAAEWGPACANKPYVNLRGLASYYQTGGSFAGLGFNYYAELDGIALHFFSIAPNALAYMRTHRDIAAQDPYNLKIIVTEYGTTSPDEINVYREQLQANLGNYTPGSGANQYDGNPFKLMWYSEEVPMGLTTGATDAITRPIGLGWQNDHGANN